MAGRHDEGDGKRRDALDPPVPQTRRGLPWWVTALALVGALALVIVFVAIPVRLTSTSSYCTSCHAMQAAGRSWHTSVHSSVPCVRCHIDPGLGHAVVWRIQEAKNIWASYLDAGKGMAASVHRPSDAACLTCHPLSGLSDVVNGVKIPHASHVGMHNLTCADCHDEVSHAPAGQPAARAAQASMSVCSMCHNGRAAPDTCTTCHTTAPPTGVHPRDFVATHGRQALGHEADCLRCHHDKAQFCDACHSRPPATHFVGDWRYSHGPAATADRQGCLGCHNEQTFCTQCHQVDHPTDWPTTHGVVAAEGTASCLVCHQKSMCTACHTARGVKP